MNLIPDAIRLAILRACNGAYFHNQQKYQIIGGIPVEEFAKKLRPVAAEDETAKSNFI